MSDPEPLSDPSVGGAAAAVFDVSDETFERDVVDRSQEVAVVVDLWAPWCGPCRTLGPLLERSVEATDGAVVLAKVNVDENPAVSAAFQVQGIPAVYALKGGKVVDGFIGAQPEQVVEAFIASLRPTEEDVEIARLQEAGDEESLRAALELAPGEERTIAPLAELLVSLGRGPEALDLLERIPESAETRRIAALARSGDDLDDDVDAKLDELLERVRDDDAARQEFVDLLELLGPDDPRTATYRKALTARLF